MDHPLGVLGKWARTLVWRACDWQVVPSLKQSQLHAWRMGKLWAAAFIPAPEVRVAVRRLSGGKQAGHGERTIDNCHSREQPDSNGVVVVFLPFLHNHFAFLQESWLSHSPMTAERKPLLSQDPQGLGKFQQWWGEKCSKVIYSSLFCPDPDSPGSSDQGS